MSCACFCDRYMYSHISTYHKTKHIMPKTSEIYLKHVSNKHLAFVLDLYILHWNLGNFLVGPVQQAEGGDRLCPGPRGSEVRLSGLRELFDVIIQRRLNTWLVRESTLGDSDLCIMPIRSKYIVSMENLMFSKFMKSFASLFIQKSFINVHMLL